MIDYHRHIQSIRSLLLASMNAANDYGGVVVNRPVAWRLQDIESAEHNIELLDYDLRQALSRTPDPVPDMLEIQAAAGEAGPNADFVAGAMWMMARLKPLIRDLHE